jgi:hypothetical protein
MLAAAVALGQPPVARITGPKDARCGSLIVLDASESTGTGRMWLLAVSPEETSFLPVESGLKCIFASPVSGVYRFVLVVAGTNANGGPAADMATHQVTLSGGLTPPITPPVDLPTDPTQPPLTRKPTAVTYVYEKDQNLCPRPVAAALQSLNAAGGIVASDFDKDVVDGTGAVPDQYRVALDAAIKVGLPALVVQSGAAVIRVVKDPKTAEQVAEAIK